MIHESAKTRISALEQYVSDIQQRLDTLQTPWWKRFFVFWLWEGWPWHNLNADRPGWRPWHGLRLDEAIRTIRVSA